MFLLLLLAAQAKGEACFDLRGPLAMTSDPTSREPGRIILATMQANMEKYWPEGLSILPEDVVQELVLTVSF